MNPEEKVKITYYTPMQERSSTVAIFGCHVISHDLYLSKCKLIRNKDGGLFVAYPSEKYTDPKTGKEAYSNFAWYGQKLGATFREMAIESLKSHCLKKGLPDPTIAQPEPTETHFRDYGSTVPYPSATFTGLNSEEVPF